jgi:tetratricopeptide (TPR) repeat protein
MKKEICAVDATLFFVAVFMLIFPVISTVDAETCGDWAARIDSFHGKVEVKRSSDSDWQQVRPKEAFCTGDMIRVPDEGRAVIVLRNETLMRLDRNTTVTLSVAARERPSLLDLLKGAAYFISRTPQKFRVNTPFLNAGIEGTEFALSVHESDTLVTVFEGLVLAENSSGSVRVAGNQTAVAEAGKAPVIRVVAQPRDAVHWTLYYPQVFTAAPDAMEAWTRQATSYLAAGRADEARSIIESALSKDKTNADALALLSTIAVAQNNSEKALEYAEAAVAVSPRSVSAYISLSYARQARFDLRGAEQAVRQAVANGPENGLAWARLSELRLSFGDQTGALEAADKAVAAEPTLSRTQSVLGFAYLAQLKTLEAVQFFEKALSLDQSDPMPRLGLGIVRIRIGELEEGRREIEVAMSLDPGNALIRSYLGKAYYEERRDSVAAGQFNMAKDADPKDPTAFFYDAIRKQAQNRPVEALHDLQRSIELNDNRAVFRSRLLLDEDLAARSASLARIYDDLGFQQLALAEGHISVNADPANHSAHRFLADAYAALPRHEIARVSELLQSQLLQPLNLSPVQPHLAEANLFILNGAGPADVSFNEFNPLFSRNRASLQLSGVVGSHNTFGNEIVVAGLHNRLSVSAGQFHYETNGFRPNNDLREDIFNLFAQYSISHRTSLQTELRSTVKTYGDLVLRFDPDNFFPASRQRDEDSLGRIGFHHSFGPGSDLIGNFGYQRGESSYHDELPPFISSIDLNKKDNNSYGAELQYLLRKEKLNLIAGTGYFSIDRSITTAIDFPPLISDTTEYRISHANAYLYSNISYPKNVTFTFGLSADQFKNQGFDKDQFNPKLGFIWTPSASTSIRAALFRTLKRVLQTNQTLEPTHVAGFNQFYEDAEGTEAWAYGVGADQKFSKDIHGGLEYLLRNLAVPISSFTGAVEIVDWTERSGRAYLYWTPRKWVSLSAEYLYERFTEATEPVPPPLAELIKTHRFPFGIRFYHPSGFSAYAKAAYVKQEGKFPPFFSTEESSFWTVDAAVSYRLPARLGIVSLTAKNLFDKSFRYQDMDHISPSMQPKRSVFFKLTMAI